MEKTLKISEEAHRCLTDCGRKGETYDEIIKRLVDHYKEYKELGD